VIGGLSEGFDDPLEGLDGPERDAVARFLADLRAQARQEPVPPIGDELARLMAGRRAGRRRALVGLSAAAAVAAVLGVGWAGAHGDLPRPIQQVVASMARSVGIDVPDGTPPPITGARRPAVAPVGAERDSGRAVRAGTPLGQGGTPPGQVDQDTPPGQGGEAGQDGRGRSDTAPGQQGTPPGQGGGGIPPGQVDQGTPPGQGGTPPGRGR
jgi:hypothetical protein